MEHRRNTRNSYRDAVCYAVTYGAVLLPAACQQQAEVRYTTEHLEITPYFDAPICGGTLTALERDVVRVQALLGLPIDAPVGLHVGEAAVAERCRPARSGCTRKNQATGASWSTMAHEIVHAVGTQAQATDWFIEEGVAQALASEVLDPHVLNWEPAEEHRSPSDQIGMSHKQFEAEYVDPATGEAFVLWLIGRFGIESLISFKSRVRAGAPPDSVVAAFEDAFDIPFSVAEEAFYQQGALKLLRDGRCQPPSQAWNGPRWEWSPILDCDASSTHGPGLPALETMSVWTTFDLAEDATIEVDVSGDVDGTLSFTACGCDLFPPANPAAYGKWLAVPSTARLDFARCRWLVLLETEFGKPAQGEVQLLKGPQSS